MIHATRDLIIHGLVSSAGAGAVRRVSPNSANASRRGIAWDGVGTAGLSAREPVRGIRTDGGRSQGSRHGPCETLTIPTCEFAATRGRSNPRQGLTPLETSLDTG